MHNKLQTFIAFCALIAANNIYARTETFDGPDNEGYTLISETGDLTSTPNPSLYPILAQDAFPVSIIYTPASANEVITSAILRVWLLDDLTSDFNNFPNLAPFDAPMEYALVKDISDGAGTFPDTQASGAEEGGGSPGLPGDPGTPAIPDVYPNPYRGINPGGLADIATANGIENPVQSLPTADWDETGLWYEVDVTSLVSVENSGALTFSLESEDNYPGIFKYNIPGDMSSGINPVWQAVTTLAQANNPGFEENPYLVLEDYVYEKAELVVTYAPALPPQTSPARPIPTVGEWGLGILITLMGMVAFARRRQTL